RMELNAMERPGTVPDAHDLVFVSPGADDKIGIVESLPADHQAMIARGLEGIGQPCKDALAVVMNPGGLAVHDTIIADDFAAKDVSDALMPQTDAQNWDRCRKAFDDLV